MFCLMKNSTLRLKLQLEGEECSGIFYFLHVDLRRHRTIPVSLCSPSIDYCERAYYCRQLIMEYNV